ncbi:syntaxin protein [Cardiosporidium cionae]|uniref:Syntaxin protein n=1 Tax=Cardiosporidium cionae TaxID=476202 RepID=A0ABQ7JBF2_9APIC|nr:syntaxin protein [Cardiosporidium cionae]|eukprot:KAF8821234.1 syntaxin protein [Cardiosporidium cionae]
MRNRIDDLFRLAEAQRESSSNAMKFDDTVPLLGDQQGEPILFQTEDEQLSYSDSAPTSFLSGISTDAESPSLTNRTASKGLASSTYTLPEFFQRVSIIKLAIREISANIDHISRLKHSMQHTVSPEKEKDLHLQIQDAFGTTVSFVSKTKTALDTIQHSNLEFLRFCGDAAEGRIRKTVHSGLSKKFREVVHDFRMIQGEYKEHMQQRMTRQIKLVYPEAPPVDIERIVETGDTAVTAAFEAHLVKGEETIEGPLLDLKAKSEELLKLEKGLAELHQMYLDLAEYIDIQGDTVEHIEVAVNRAADFSECTYKDILEAKKSREASRQRMFWLSAFLLIVAIFVLLPSFLHLLPRPS